MLCCVCLLENPTTVGIYEENGRKLNMPQIIQQHLWFKPVPNDELRSHICLVCWERINDFHEFYQQAERIHAEYQLSKKNRLNIKQEETATGTNPIKQEHDEKDDVYSGILQLEIEIGEPAKSQELDEKPEKNPLEDLQKDLETEIDGNLEDDDVKVLDIWKSNPLEDDEFNAAGTDSESDNGSQSDDYEQSEYSNEEESTSPEEEEEGVDEDVANKADSNKEKKKTERRKRKSKQTTKQQTDDVKKKRKVQYKFDHQHTEEMIQKHIPMGCNLCVYVGKTFADIVGHFKEFHQKIRPYIMCCDKKFTKRFYVAQHALKHEDPNCFKCNECNKSFTTTCGLRTHNLNYHAPEEERTFACDLCPKKFARQNLLELHKPSHIPREQWEFFCDKCPTRKAFASLYLLNVHTSMQHKRAKHICHVCAKEIRDKHSFEKHVRLHFEQSGPRVPCPYPDCDSWLKDEDNLKQHLKRHNPEGIIYKCPECDKVVKNRRALTNHKRYSHSNATFQCEQCDKTFKKAISLREHMTQHTGETLYKCPFCPRTFNSNANMHAHKKRAHPVEWEEWRRNKTGSAQVLIKHQNLSSL
ncbi:grauzone [Musca autumnalis]|uniref:grauzone n=1 Tax=Musca autumnalis TaxID=221902 RepID=UPI003CF24A13